MKGHVVHLKELHVKKMGFWGYSLYANDTTCDVRDSYLYFLRERLSDDDILVQIMNRYQEYLNDANEAPLVWYALAESMWRHGRLNQSVKKEALNWIEQRGGIDLFRETSNHGKSWEKTLDKLKDKLLSEMPPPKRVKKQQEFNHNPWNVGDIYAYRFHTQIAKEYQLYGQYIPFIKIGEGFDFGNKISSVIRVFDIVFDNLPQIVDLEGVRFLPLCPTDIKKMQLQYTRDEYQAWLEKEMSAVMQLQKPSKYPKEYFFYIGTITVPVNSDLRYTCFSWERDKMEEWLVPFYTQWRGLKYYDDNTGND